MSDEYGRNCLIARRLVERGVRFIQLYSGGGHLEETWDAHESIEKNHGRHGLEIDQPVSALLTDLAQRGLLDETLVPGTGWSKKPGRIGPSPAVPSGIEPRALVADDFQQWLRAFSKPPCGRPTFDTPDERLPWAPASATGPIWSSRAVLLTMRQPSGNLAGTGTANLDCTDVVAAHAGNRSGPTTLLTWFTRRKLFLTLPKNNCAWLWPRQKECAGVTTSFLRFKSAITSVGRS